MCLMLSVTQALSSKLIALLKKPPTGGFFMPRPYVVGNWLGRWGWVLFTSSSWSPDAEKPPLGGFLCVAAEAVQARYANTAM